MSTYLRRTCTGGNQQIATFSAWVKKTQEATENCMFLQRADASNFFRIRFNNDQINFNSRVSGTDYYGTTTAFYRDTSSFYHIVLTVNTTESTSSDRFKLYINNVQQVFTASSYPGSSANLQMNVNGMQNDVGGENGGNYFKGIMAHVHWVDGTAYTPSTFGETDSTSGIWKPKTSPTVTYGTNGFFLKFANSGSLGLDSSGNTNNFTLTGNGFQTQDSPSNVFAIFNRNDRHGGSTNNYGDYLTKGNTRIDIASAQKGFLRSTIGVKSGKWYWEAKVISKSKGFYGVCNNTAFGTTSASVQGTTFPSGIWYYENGPNFYAFNHQTNNTSIASIANDDILGFALDMDNHAFYVHKNGTYMNSGSPTSGSSRTGSIPELFTNGRNVLTDHGEVFVNHYVDSSSGSTSVAYNFGNGYFDTTAVASSNADGNGFGLFEYSVPSGYYALCTKNVKQYGG